MKKFFETIGFWGLMLLCGYLVGLALDAIHADMTFIGFVFSGLIYSLVWERKQIKKDYVSSDIYEEQLARCRLKYERNIGNRLDLFAIKKTCNVTGELVSVYFHPYKEDGKRMLKFNGCGIRDECEGCEKCVNESFEIVHKLNTGKETFESTQAFKVKSSDD